MHPGASAHLPRPSTYTRRRVPTWLAAAPVRKSGTRATAEKVTRSPSPSFPVPDTFTYDDGDANLCLCLGPIPRACRLTAIFTICWNCSKPLARSVRPFASAPSPSHPFPRLLPSRSFPRSQAASTAALREFPTTKWPRYIRPFYTIRYTAPRHPISFTSARSSPPHTPASTRPYSNARTIPSI